MSLSVCKKFRQDYFPEREPSCKLYQHPIFTLNTSEVTAKNISCEHIIPGRKKIYHRTHEDDWCISGEIKSRCYQGITEFFVKQFQAEHPVYGKIMGDFEIEVYADSEEGFQHFYTHHKPVIWDYYNY